ncbi:hypothetical protein RB653_004434 [Dictyostelium firmibasis]|uniref:Zinc-ribbon domain-containing protein n=1 Tax=Dictyostelium firmibasis TaxID=79012 RepID=A0AAN7Z3C0_9MYCE
MIQQKKSKSLYWFFVGILYILIWETIICIAYKEIESEKQVYRDISKSIFQNLQESIDRQTKQDIDNNNYKINQDNDNIIRIDKPTNEPPPITTTTTTMDSLSSFKPSSIVDKMIGELPPFYFTFNVTNSSMTMPMNMTWDKFNVSDINISAPHIEFPLDFSANNMTFNISVEAETFPISMNLIANKSDVPISLGIYGADSIPVTLNVNKMEAPLLNYFFFAIFGAINGILLIWVIIQQVSIQNLKKRLDTIDISNDVLKGKRYKRGNVWYKSINSDVNDHSSENEILTNSRSSNRDQIIDINGNDTNNSNNSNINHSLVSICKQCGQTNGKTKFCFNCGSSLIS